jgi:hypothetical protein
MTQLAFISKASLGLFWTLVHVLIYCHVVHVSVSSFLSTFWHERVVTVEKFYTRDAHATLSGVLFLFDGDCVHV